MYPGVGKLGLTSLVVQVSRMPSRRMWLHTAAASVREAPRQEIAGGFEVYGDLTGAAMMAARA